VLFLGFLKVLEECEKWEILYIKSYKIFIFYRYVRRGCLKIIKEFWFYTWVDGFGGMPASPLRASASLNYNINISAGIKGHGGAGGRVRRRNTLHVVGGRE
jgi:hypothetical protein